jgi:tetratricopeptide (TPR) repeat protein
MSAPANTPAEQFIEFYGRNAWQDWQRLVAHFDLSEGFAFLVLLLPGAVGAEICHRNLSEHLAGKGKRLEELPCQWREDVLRLAQRLFAVQAAENLGGIWIGTVIPDSDREIQSWRQAWRVGLAALNEQRNSLKERFACPLVLVGAPWLQQVLREAAPDLWSIRTGVVSVLPTLDTTATREAGRIEIETARSVAGEAAADPDYTLEQAERLRGRPGLETQRARLLLRAGIAFFEHVRWDSAEHCFREAADLFSAAAGEDPDLRANLAATLNNLANVLSRLGRREEALSKAQEAVRIYEQLAQARPDAFLPDLAMSLNNLAIRLSDLGQREEALSKAQEAVRIREQLAQARPDAFLPSLAMSLNNLAISLGGLGRREEALAKAQEAVRIYGQLAQARPDAFLPDLAISLNNLANTLSDLGRREEALAKAQEALRIYEQLAQARPDAFLPNLAISCGARGAILEQMGKYADAAGSFAEGIRLMAALFQKSPPAFAKLVADLCKAYIRACQRAQIEPESALLAPINEVLRQLEQSTKK